MRRREFITLLGGLAAWPLVAHAQPERMRRLGVLSNMGESDSEAQAYVAALRQGLQVLGWAEGRNLRIDRRWATGIPGRLQTLANELVGLQPDVLVAHTTLPTIALKKETQTIPIVFVQVTDPIGTGFIANLAHPGGNITGFTSFESSMSGKWVEMLKEIAPSVVRVGLIFNPETAPYVTRYFQQPFEAAARSFAAQPIINPVRNELEIESAMAALGREPGGGLVVMPDSFNQVHHARFISMAARYSLPTIYPWKYTVAEGGLLSYGDDQADLFRRAAAYVDRILKGMKPFELPVQAPTKFELSVNLKTAKALGLTIPPTLLATADEVIN
jgi:putative tryptophan/tyrosine transport system substrate-binding protein